MEYLHYGVPTEERLEGLSYQYLDTIKLYVTDPNTHPLKLQFVYADQESPLPEVVRTMPHVSINTVCIEDVLDEFDTIDFAPTKVKENLRICFARKDGVLFELMETSA